MSRQLVVLFDDEHKSKARQHGEYVCDFLGEARRETIGAFHVANLFPDLKMLPINEASRWFSTSPSTKPLVSPRSTESYTFCALMVNIACKTAAFCALKIQGKAGESAKNVPLHRPRGNSNHHIPLSFTKRSHRKSQGADVNLHWKYNFSGPRTVLSQQRTGSGKLPKLLAAAGSLQPSQKLPAS